MIIYFCLLIPMIAVIFLAIKFHKSMAWWEYLLVYGVPALIIVVTNYASVATQTMTPEIWNTYLTQATYYEPWNEYIHKTCCSTCTDSKGNSHECNCHDCSYVQYHPARWEAKDNIGHTSSISPAYYAQLCQVWNNRTFEDKHRPHYTIDGDAYNTVKDTVFDHIVPRTSTHSYENRVKCSKSVFNFAEVDSGDIADYKLFQYPPAVEFGYNPILGFYDPKASLRLQQYNAQYGSWKQVHMLILVFKDLPVKAAIMQEGLWKGGNKNEFILCLGVKDTSITWAKVISWTEVDELKVHVEKEVMGMPLNMTSIVDYMAKQVGLQFQRKHFKEFSYISVEPTMTAIWIALALSILSTVGLCIFAVKNDFDQNGRKWNRRF
jgi:hypothetical protein